MARKVQSENLFVRFLMAAAAIAVLFIAAQCSINDATDRDTPPENRVNINPMGN